MGVRLFKCIKMDTVMGLKVFLAPGSTVSPPPLRAECRVVAALAAEAGAGSIEPPQSSTSPRWEARRCAQRIAKVR